MFTFFAKEKPVNHLITFALSAICRIKISSHLRFLHQNAINSNKMPSRSNVQEIISSALTFFS